MRSAIFVLGLLLLITGCSDDKKSSPPPPVVAKAPPIETPSFDVTQLQGYWKVKSKTVADIFPKFGYLISTENTEYVVTADDDGQVEIEIPGIDEREMDLLLIEGENYKMKSASSSQVGAGVVAKAFIVSGRHLLDKEKHSLITQIKEISESEMRTQDGTTYSKITEDEFKLLSEKQKKIWVTQSNAEENELSLKVVGGNLDGKVYEQTESSGFGVTCGPHRKEGLFVKANFQFFKQIGEEKQYETSALFLRIGADLGMSKKNYAFNKKTVTSVLSNDKTSPIVLSYIRDQFVVYNEVSSYRLFDEAQSQCTFDVERNNAFLITGSFSCKNVFVTLLVKNKGMSEQKTASLSGTFSCQLSNMLFDEE